MKRVIAGIAATVTIATIGAATAHADTVRLPNHQRTIQLDGGGKAFVASQGERIDRVAPLTTAGTTKEIFLSVRAIGGADLPSKGSAVLETGYQIGCMASFEGVGIGLGATLGIGGTAGTGGGSLGPNASIGPTINVNVGPGQIKDIPLGKKELNASTALIRIRDAHINVDGCIGPASARSYTRLSVSTALVDDGAIVYGRVLGI